MKKFLLLLFGCLFAVTGFAQRDFQPGTLLKSTAPAQLVTDLTGTLTSDQRQALENKLVSFDDSTSTQIAVVIIPTLGDYEINDYNVKLGRAWGVGGKEFNNGIVLLIAKDDHKLNIATGYGAEGALPDVTAKHIIDDEIVPNFKGNDYYRGIDQGTDAIIKTMRGEYNVQRTSRSTSSGGSRIFFFILVIIIILLFSGRKGGGGNYMSRRGGSSLANTLFWTSLLSGGGGRGGGGWSGGGGGGGGFGGFGGGSFGGGGASGSW